MNKKIKEERKKHSAVFIPVCLISLIFIIVFPVSAGEYTYRADEIGENAALEKWDKLTEELPDELKEDFGSLRPDLAASSGIREKTSPRFWLIKAWEKIKEASADILPDLSLLLTLLVIMAVAKASLPEMSGPLSDTFLFCGRVAVALPLISSTYRAISVAKEYLTRVTGLMNLLVPVMETLYLSDGSLTEAAVSTTGITLAVTVIGNINATLMTPITSVLFTLSAVSSVCTDTKLGGVTESVRKLLQRLWQILTLFFSFMIGTQSVIARSADTLASRTARFAITSMIPVAGGIISEAYNTLKEGVAYIRTVCGIGGIILVLLILLSGIVPLVVYKAVFGITSFLSGMLGLDRTSALLGEIKKIIDFIIAIVMYTSMMLVFALVLFAKSRSTI